MTIQDQIAASRARIRELKEVTPGIFPEYSRWKIAERALRSAELELDAAFKAWLALGADPS